MGFAGERRWLLCTAFPVSVEKRGLPWWGREHGFLVVLGETFWWSPEALRGHFLGLSEQNVLGAAELAVLSSGSLTSDLLLTSLDLPTLPVPGISLCPDYREGMSWEYFLQ